jgi:hypothetical protein
MAQLNRLGPYFLQHCPRTALPAGKVSCHTPDLVDDAVQFGGGVDADVVFFQKILDA